MSHKNSDFQTSWNLRFSTLEPKPSLVFWLDTSVDVASGRPVSRSIDSSGLFLAKEKMEECFDFTHRGNFQALKVSILNLSYVSQLCDLKYWVIKVGI
jgi:hypothetical protein